MNTELEQTKQHLADKVPFDDQKQSSWNAWTLPPHDHAREKSLVGGCLRGVLALCTLAEAYAACCEAEGRLLRIRSHHPAILDGVVETEGRMVTGEVILRDAETRERERMFTEMAAMTRAMVSEQAAVAHASGADHRSTRKRRKENAGSDGSDGSDDEEEVVVEEEEEEEEEGPCGVIAGQAARATDRMSAEAPAIVSIAMVL